MDYFHADRRPVWRRSPGPDAFPAPSNTGPWPSPSRPTGKACATSKTCLSVHASKLYHMGFRQPVRRSTLADANERRDWRIHAALAQRLITQARTLYVDEELGLDLTNTVYALDSTTIALCLSVFPWAHFRTTKAAVKMHTLLDLRGNIPSFIHISDGKLHDVHALDMLLPEAGAIYVVDRGYVDFARLYVLHQAGAFFVTRAKSNIDAHRVYSGADGSLDRHHLRPDHLPGRLLHPSGLPRTSAAHPLQGPRVRQDAGLHHQQLLASGRHHLRALQKAAGRWNSSSSGSKQHLRIKQFYGTSENAVKTQIWIAVSVYVLVAIVKKRLDLGRLALHFVTDPLGDPLRENAHTSSTCGRRKQMQRFAK